MLPLLLATYGMVFVAELLGDKLLYTAGALSTRYRLAPTLGGALLAFMVKMLAAVLLGQSLTKLPATALTLITTASFLGLAMAMWLKRPEGELVLPGPVSWYRGFAVSFTVIVLSEWGDVGQVTAATLAARYHAPLVVWMGATLAMTTKAVLAAVCGAAMRRVFPVRALRYVGAGLMLTLGLFSLLRID